MLIADLEREVEARRATVAELTTRLEQARAARGELHGRKKPHALAGVQGDIEAKKRLAQINKELVALDAEIDDLELAHGQAEAEVGRAIAAVADAREAERRAELAVHARTVIEHAAEIDRLWTALDVALDAHDAALHACVRLERGLAHHAGSYWRLRAAVPPDLARALEMPPVRPSDRGPLLGIEHRWLSRYIANAEASPAPEPLPAAA